MNKPVSVFAKQVFAEHRKDDCGYAEHEARYPVHIQPEDAEREHVECTSLIKQARWDRRDRGLRRSRRRRRLLREV